MNEHFVCIKVDREERPDLDAIYMDAVQAMTGGGGWPMTRVPDARRQAVLRRHLLPAEPPPRPAGVPPGADGASPRRGRPARRSEAAAVTMVAAGDRAAASASGALPRSRSTDDDPRDAADRGSERAFDAALRAVRAARRSSRQPMTLRVLPAACDRDRTTRRARRRDDDARQDGRRRHVRPARRRLPPLLRRRRSWLVPHFEKMLYDNALAASGCTCTRWQVDRARALPPRRRRDLLSTCSRELRHAGGGVLLLARTRTARASRAGLFVWPWTSSWRLRGEASRPRSARRRTANWEGDETSCGVPLPLEAVAAELELGIPRSLQRELETRGEGRAVRDPRGRIHPATDDKDPHRMERPGDRRPGGGRTGVRRGRARGCRRPRRGLSSPFTHLRDDPAAAAIVAERDAAGGFRVRRRPDAA